MSLQEINWNDLIPTYSYLYEKYKNISLPDFYKLYSFNDFDNVYEPAEDTFLLSDTLEEEILTNNISNKINNTQSISIEIGCGSGFISIQYIKSILLFKRLSLQRHFCFDINKTCLEVSNKIINQMNLNNQIEVKEGFFFDIDYILSILSSNIEIKNIILIFNPPYVTTDKDELNRAFKDKDIYASWAGGENGSEVIFDFIGHLHKFISLIKNKEISICLYLLLSSENQLNEIIQNLNSTQWECLSLTQAKNERLGVFKFFFLK